MFHRRKGMANLSEAVVCVALFSTLMITMITLMSKSLAWTDNANRAYDLDINVNYLIDTFQIDVKSCDRVLIEDGTLKLYNSKESIEYYIIEDTYGKTLYRNNDIVLSNVDSCTFTISDDNSGVRLYVILESGDYTDLYIRR